MTSVYPVVYIQTPLLSQISGKGNVFKLFLHKNTDEKKKSLSCLVKKKHIGNPEHICIGTKS